MHNNKQNNKPNSMKIISIIIGIQGGARLPAGLVPELAAGVGRPRAAVGRMGDDDDNDDEDTGNYDDDDGNSKKRL